MKGLMKGRFLIRGTTPEYTMFFIWLDPERPIALLYKIVEPGLILENKKFT